MTEQPCIQPYLGHHPILDPAAFIHPRATIIGRVQIGAGCSIWPNTTLRGDDGGIVLGDRTSVQDGTVIHSTEALSENVIGAQVTIGHNCTIHGARIEGDCIIGMGSILLDNAHIGAFSIVGAGSLVTQGKVFPPRSLILGSPAKVVRPITDKELEWIAYSWRRYAQQSFIYRGLEVPEALR